METGRDRRSPALRHLSHRSRGYTLAEVMIALGLALVLAGILFGGVIFMSQSSAVLRTHHDLQSMTELALMRIERDIEEARRVVSIDAQEWRMEQEGVTAGAGGRSEIAYRFDVAGGVLLRTDVATGETRVLLEHISEGGFRYWGRGRNEETLEAEDVLRVSFDATLSRKAGRRSVVEKVVSASFLLRNIEARGVFGGS